MSADNWSKKFFSVASKFKILFLSWRKNGVFDSCHQQVTRRFQHSWRRCNTFASNCCRWITSKFRIFVEFQSLLILNFNRVPEKVRLSNPWSDDLFCLEERELLRGDLWSYNWFIVLRMIKSIELPKMVSVILFEKIEMMTSLWWPHNKWSHNSFHFTVFKVFPRFLQLHFA